MSDVRVDVRMKPPLPAGAYIGLVTDVSMHQFEPSDKFDKPDDGRRVKFTVTVSQKDGIPRELTAYASPTWSPKSKLYGWVSSLTGTEPSLFEQPDLSKLVGLDCQVVLKITEDGNFNRVEALLPLPR